MISWNSKKEDTKNIHEKKIVINGQKLWNSCNSVWILICNIKGKIIIQINRRHYNMMHDNWYEII